MSSLDEVTMTFEKFREDHMEIFHSPNASVLLIDEAVQGNVSSVGETNISHIDCGSIQVLQHSVRNHLAWINVSSTKMLVESESGMEACGCCGPCYCAWTCAVVHPELATRPRETQSSYRITCWSTSTFASVNDACGRPSFPTWSSLMFLARWKFSNRASIVSTFGPFVTLNSFWKLHIVGKIVWSRRWNFKSRYIRCSDE